MGPFLEHSVISEEAKTHTIIVNIKTEIYLILEISQLKTYFLVNGET